MKLGINTKEQFDVLTINGQNVAPIYESHKNDFLEIVKRSNLFEELVMTLIYCSDQLAKHTQTKKEIDAFLKAQSVIKKCKSC